MDEIDAQTKLFVDDTSLYLEIENPTDSADTLNRDIDWSKKN